MAEPSFVVPLSVLVDVALGNGGRWKWICRMEEGCGFTYGHSSRAEAESAAIQHLADVHGLTVAVADEDVEWAVISEYGPDDKQHVDVAHSEEDARARITNVYNLPLRRWPEAKQSELSYRNARVMWRPDAQSEWRPASEFGVDR